MVHLMVQNGFQKNHTKQQSSISDDIFSWIFWKCYGKIDLFLQAVFFSKVANIKTESVIFSSFLPSRFLYFFLSFSLAIVIFRLVLKQLPLALSTLMAANFGRYVCKNPARYIFMYILVWPFIQKISESQKNLKGLLLTGMSLCFLGPARNPDFTGTCCSAILPQQISVFLDTGAREGRRGGGGGEDVVAFKQVVLRNLAKFSPLELTGPTADWTIKIPTLCRERKLSMNKFIRKILLVLHLLKRMYLCCFRGDWNKIL